MRRSIGTLLGIFMMIFPSVAHAQDSIKVVRFERLTRDLMASTRQVKDINGQICGIIKIETNDSMFIFEPNYGILEELKKPGERILYVPVGTKSISIRHPQYVMLRNYLLPEKIDSKATYILCIDHKKRDNTLYTDFELVANVEGADVFVDDVFCGVTPFHKRIPYGKHYFVLKANKYQPAGKELNVLGPHKKFKFTLVPNKHFKYKSRSE